MLPSSSTHITTYPVNHLVAERKQKAEAGAGEGPALGLGRINSGAGAPLQGSRESIATFALLYHLKSNLGTAT